MGKAVGVESYTDIKGEIFAVLKTLIGSTVSPRGFRIIYLKLLSVSERLHLCAQEAQVADGQAWLTYL